MKKLIFFLVVLAFFKWEVKAQAVEWLLPIPNEGSSITYVNDSLIYVITTTKTTNYSFGIISNLFVINSDGKIVNSKSLNKQFPSPGRLDNAISSRNYFLEPQQKFILPDNKVMYSQTKFTIDANLNFDTIPDFSKRHPYTIEIINSEFKKAKIKSNNSNSWKFYHLDSSGTVVDSNFLIRDKCFYWVDPQGISWNGIPYFDRNKSLYFSLIERKVYSTPNNCSPSSNYIPINTIGGINKTYISQWDAVIQTVVRLDTNNDLELLPFYDNLNILNKGTLTSSFVSYPEFFHEDSKGNMVILSSDGYLGKYRSSPWDTIWTKKIPSFCNSCYGGVGVYIDQIDNIYVLSRSTNYLDSYVYTLDSLGNVIRSRTFTNNFVENIQSDSKESLYITTSNQSPPITYLDCFTFSGSYVAKLYTGSLQALLTSPNQA